MRNFIDVCVDGASQPLADPSSVWVHRRVNQRTGKPLKTPFSFRIDVEELDWASQFSWNLNSGRYVAGAIGGDTVLMHREIIEAPPGMRVVHINEDTLDNRKCNLRLHIPGQKQRSRPIPLSKDCKIQSLSRTEENGFTGSENYYSAYDNEGEPA